MHLNPTLPLEKHFWVRHTVLYIFSKIKKKKDIEKERHDPRKVEKNQNRYDKLYAPARVTSDWDCIFFIQTHRFFFFSCLILFLLFNTLKAIGRKNLLEGQSLRS